MTKSTYTINTNLHGEFTHVVSPTGNVLVWVGGGWTAGHRASDGYGRSASAFEAMEAAGFSPGEAADMWREAINARRRTL